MVCSDGLYTEGNNAMQTIKPGLYGGRAALESHAPKTSSEVDREVVIGLMRASQLTLAPLIEKDTDIYTVADLKVRF